MNDYLSEQNRIAGQDADLFDINEIFRSIWKRKISFLLPIILLLSGILAFNVLVSPKYTAKARIFIDPVGLDITRKNITPQSNTFSGNSEFVESKMGIVTSDEVLGLVVKDLNLGSDREFGKAKSGLLSSVPVVSQLFEGFDPFGGKDKTEKTGANETRAHDRALMVLRKAVKVHKSKGSYVVDVFVKTKSAPKSAKIANAIVNTFIDSQFKNRSTSAKNTSASLMKQLDLFKRRLYTAEDAVEKYKAKHNILNAGGNLFNENELTELSRELTRAQTARVLAQEKYLQYKGMENKPISLESLADVTSSRTIGQLRTNYLQVEQRKAELSQTLMPSHPALLTVNNQLKNMRAGIAQEIKRIAKSSQHDFTRLEKTEQRLAQKVNEIKKQTVSTNLASVKLKELERDVEVSRLVYKTNMIRAREIGEQETVNTSNSRVISPALTPTKSDRKLLPLLLLMGLGGGSILGILLAIIRERLSKYIGSSRELRAVSGLPVIKELPYYKKDFFARLGNLNNSKKLFRKMESGTGEKSTQKFISKTLQSPEVMSSSQIRDLLYNYRDTKGQQTLFVMSSGQKDEKGTVTLNLALAASMAGDRVLLVDSDVAHGELSQDLAGNVETGLKAVVEGRAKLKEAVIEGYNPTLKVLPVENNGIISNAVNSANIQKHILDKASDYDLVIFDGGVTGINIYAHSFAEVSDDIIFIARESVTPVEQFKNIIQNMRPYTSKIRGTVFYNS